MTILSLLRHSKVVLVFRICIGGFFLIAGAAKLSQPAGLFANQIKSFGILLDSWVLPTAYFLPWFELFAGTFLLVGIFSRWAAFFIGIQLVAFAAVISAAFFMGEIPEDCGCLPGVSETPAQALVRDLVMLSWLAVSFHGLPGSLSLDQWFGSNYENKNFND